MLSFHCIQWPWIPFPGQKNVDHSPTNGRMVDILTLLFHLQIPSRASEAISPARLSSAYPHPTAQFPLVYKLRWGLRFRLGEPSTQSNLSTLTSTPKPRQPLLVMSQGSCNARRSVGTMQYIAGERAYSCGSWDNLPEESWRPNVSHSPTGGWFWSSTECGLVPDCLGWTIRLSGNLERFKRQCVSCSPPFS